MGIYKKYAAQFPLQEFEPGPFQDKVNALKDAVSEKDREPATLAARYRHLRKRRARAEEIMSRISAAVAATEQLFWSACEGAGVESVKLQDGFYMGVTDDLAVSTTCREDVNAWIRRSGLERLLSVNSNTLSGLVKDRILAGEEVPEGIAVKSYKKTTYRKGNS